MSRGHGGFAGHAFTVAGFAVAFLAWIGFIFYQAGSLPTFGDKYTFEVDVPSASLLTPGARVTAAGAEVGTVARIERTGSLTGGARLTLELTDKRVTPVPSDTRVQVRTRTQVGENYVSLDVGQSDRDLPNQGRLPDKQADPVIEVDQILSMLRGKTKGDARQFLRQFGDTLAGRGEALNQTLARTGPTVHNGLDVVDVLHANRETAGQLVDQLGRLTAAVGSRAGAIDTIARRGLVSLRAIGDRDTALAATLRELPATLVEARRTTLTVGDVSGRATPVVSDLATAVDDLRPAVDALEPAARGARGLVGDLGAANPELARLISAAGRATRPLPAALPGVRRTFCELNPALRFIKPFRTDILQSVFHLGSGSNAYDATGHLVRLVPLISENSLSGAPPAVIAASRTLLASGAFLPQKQTNYHPFMKQGEIGKTVATSNQPSGPASLRESGYKYPRVRADC